MSILQPSPNVPGLVQAWVEGRDGSSVLVLRHDHEPEVTEVWLQSSDRQQMAGARLGPEQMQQLLAIVTEAAATT